MLALALYLPTSHQNWGMMSFTKIPGGKNTQIWVGVSQFFFGIFWIKKRLCHFPKIFLGNFFGLKKGSLYCGVFLFV